MKRLMTLLLVGLLVLVIPPTTLAVAKDTPPLNPKYTYTRTVKAKIENVSGNALCLGSIRVNSSTSSISATVTLYKKNGNVWNQVASWSDSTSGSTFLTISNTRSVSAGAYRVTTVGIITAASGATEYVSETSDIVTFS